MTLVERRRTAMMRTGLSKPVSVALADGLLPLGTSIFDYGCGRGGDVLRLAALGYDATGWDPGHAADSVPREADVVNLGYVVNVIEDPHERVDVLRSAWSLTRQTLVVAARPDWEARHVRGQRHGDGILTTKGTFQKFFKQDELRSWIDSHLSVHSIAAAPGIFYIFRDDSHGQRFLARRVRHRPSANRQPKVNETLYKAHKVILDPIVKFAIHRGRLPGLAEIPNGPEIENIFGHIKTALSIAREAIGDEIWNESRETARRDLVVYLALAAFRGRAKFGSLPDDLQQDVKALFGSYKAACDLADETLFSVADQTALNSACMTAPFGKLTPEALYVHVSATSRLSPLLRVYEGCGRALTGAVEGSTLVKFNRLEPKVSYLTYPEFDEDPHPALQASLRADLRQLHVKYTDFSRSDNPPILHRKEIFVPSDYPSREKFLRLTRQEERAGLFEETSTIGTRNGWQARLDRAGYRLGGHRLMRPT